MTLTLTAERKTKEEVNAGSLHFLFLRPIRLGHFFIKNLLMKFYYLLSANILILSIVGL